MIQSHFHSHLRNIRKNNKQKTSNNKKNRAQIKWHIFKAKLPKLSGNMCVCLCVYVGDWGGGIWVERGQVFYLMFYLYISFFSFILLDVY